MDSMTLYKKEVNLIDSFFVNRRDGKGKQVPLPFRVKRSVNGKLQMVINQKYLCVPVHVPFAGSTDSLHRAIGDIGREVYNLRAKAGYTNPVNVIVSEQPPMLIVPRVDPKNLEYKDHPSVNRRRGMLIGQSFNGNAMEPLIIDLDDPNTCHGLVGASTGGGKSTMMKQMMLSACEMTSPEDLQFAIIDIGEKSFKLFAQLPHCCAYVTTIEDSLALLRKFESQMTGQENTYRTRIAIFVDEGAALLATGDEDTDKEFRRLLKICGDRGRAYGFSLWIGAQNPTDSSVPADVRYNLGVRVAGSCSEATRSEIILDKGNRHAASITMPGVFYVKIKNIITMVFSYSLKQLVNGEEVSIEFDEVTKIRREFDKCEMIELLHEDDEDEDALPQHAIDAAIEVLKEFTDENGELRNGYIMKTKDAIAKALNRKRVTGNSAPLFNKYLDYVVYCYKTGDYQN